MYGQPARRHPRASPGGRSVPSRRLPSSGLHCGGATRRTGAATERHHRGARPTNARTGCQRRRSSSQNRGSLCVPTRLITTTPASPDSILNVPYAARVARCPETLSPTGAISGVQELPRSANLRCCARSHCPCSPLRVCRGPGDAAVNVGADVARHAAGEEARGTRGTSDGRGRGR